MRYNTVSINVSLNQNIHPLSMNAIIAYTRVTLIGYANT